MEKPFRLLLERELRIFSIRRGVQRNWFQHPYFGYPRVNNQKGWLGRTHVYRFFVQDPFYFDKSCKFTIEHGHNNNLTLDLASVAYWYQEKASALARSFSKEERQPKPIIDTSKINVWRNIWKFDNSGKALHLLD